MTAIPSRGRAAILALAAVSAAAIGMPAAAYNIPGAGTHFENFDNFPSASYYIEDALPGAYVIDGYATRYGANGYLTSYNGYDAVQIDFYQPQDFVSFTSVNLNGVVADAYTNPYIGKPVEWLGRITVGPSGTPSNTVYTLSSPMPADPTLYRPRISTIVFFSAGGGWAIDNLTWSTSAPEPATWGMMLGGFGMLGGALRSNRRRSACSFAA